LVGAQIKGEELSVLPGMDPILAMGAIERLTGFTGGLFKGVGKKGDNKEYDVVVYDGLSSDGT
jgi:anion-transporting  ArsA/GET3 family ATPase